MEEETDELNYYANETKAILFFITLPYSIFDAIIRNVSIVNHICSEGENSNGKHEHFFEVQFSLAHRTRIEATLREKLRFFAWATFIIAKNRISPTHIRMKNDNFFDIKIILGEYELFLLVKNAQEVNNCQKETMEMEPRAHLNMYIFVRNILGIWTPKDIAQKFEECQHNRVFVEKFYEAKIVFQPMNSLCVTNSTDTVEISDDDL